MNRAPTLAGGTRRLLAAALVGVFGIGAVAVAPLAPSVLTPASAAVAVPSSALILDDSTGPFSFLGEQYAMMTANLASHFGTWTGQAGERLHRRA